MGSERMPPAIERKVGMSFLRAVRAMIFFLTKSGFTGSFDPVRVRLGRSCSDWQRKTRLGECRAGLEARSVDRRSEEHTSELQSLMRISYAVFCLKKQKQQKPISAAA